MLNILLLGVVHEYQQQSPKFLYLPKDKAEIYLGQLASYSRWVREQITTIAQDGGSIPEVIFDEMNLPEWEPFNRLEDVGVHWVYMDIPERVRKRFKLTADDRGPGKEIIPEIDEPRERHWFKVIESISTECKLSTVVVLCGAAHLPTFSKKLTDAGHSVKSVDCRDTDWYSRAYVNAPIYPE